MAIARSGLTLEQFLDLPEEKPALEYEYGQVTQKVSPKGEHSAIQGDLVQLFDRALRPERIARAFIELRTTFADSSRVPDVSVYRWECIPRNERGGIANDVFTPPDIAIEIRSPLQSLSAQRRRCRDYVSQGVALALLIDPETLRISRFVPGEPEQILRANEPIVFEPVLPSFRLTPNEIFAALQVD